MHVSARGSAFLHAERREAYDFRGLAQSKRPPPPTSSNSAYSTGATDYFNSLTGGSPQGVSLFGYSHCLGNEFEASILRGHPRESHVNMTREGDQCSVELGLYEDGMLKAGLL